MTHSENGVAVEPRERVDRGQRTRRLLCLGLGYTARALVSQLRPETEIAGTARSADKADALHRIGVRSLVYDGERPSAALGEAIRAATHVLVSAAPDAQGDPFLRHHERDFAQAGNLEWVGYLSSVAVYGDHGGGWVDERAICRPTSERGELRLEAETAWTALGTRCMVHLGVFRLAGIYGPGRNAFVALANSEAKRVIKPGQVFNRIHVDDIAAVLRRAMERPASRIYNVADNEPAPPQDVIAFAARLMGVAPPPEEPFETAELSAMARSFYGEVKRVANARLREELGVRLAFPTYREGLTALWESGRWRG